MSKYCATVSSLRMVGTQEEIKRMLQFFRDSDCLWHSNDKYYPQREGNGKFAYYMNNIQVPADPIAQSDDPQPRPWDAVLGGKG
ncbi:MAG: hypothetical protein ACRCZS_21015 [Chroococcidiopsis sp.]